MGTFAGHAVPGSAFLVWGVWWYTWMWQIGYMLFYIQYDTANHANVMRADLFSTWHCLGVAILMYLAYWVVHKRRDSLQARTGLAGT